MCTTNIDMIRLKRQVFCENFFKLNKFDIDKKYSLHIGFCYLNHKKKELISKLPKSNKLIRMSQITFVEINEDINQCNFIRIRILFKYCFKMRIILDSFIIK